MGLEARIRQLRSDAIAQGRDPVATELQGVTKARIAEVLSALNRDTPDQVDVVFALLDDVQDSWFSCAPTGARFCDAATIAHLACHVGILQRGGLKLDREGRDYWIKPLRDIGAVEPVFLNSRTREFLPGHPIAKSPNSAHRLAQDFKRILLAPAIEWKALLSEWIEAERIRERLAFQAKQANEALGTVATPHSNLIRACVTEYAPRFLAGFEVVYVDDSDGDRIDDEDRERLRDAGLELTRGDPSPDVLLYNRELNELWVVEAVTSDGEVDQHKLDRMLAFADRYGKEGVGFTTAYPTWKVAARRQGAQKNIPPATYVWIREDGSKHYRAEDFGRDGNRPSTIRSKPS
ncbi:MAG: BsuBI/PstI family type II restriction endonuclease [Planctomycetota bacterium]